MFNAISSFMRSLVGAQRSAAVLLEEQADHAWLDAERTQAAAAWAVLSDDERGAVIDWCDRLDAEGRLEDHRFFEQWLAVRMRGYVGD